MPNTVVGVALIVLVLLPGVAYHASVRRKFPAGELSTPTPAVLVSGTMSAFVAVAVVLCVEEIWSTSLTAPDDLIGDGAGQYVARNPLALVVTAGIVVSVAYLVAILAARRRATLLNRPSQTGHTAGNVWWTLFRREQAAEGLAFAVVKLVDGTVSAGRVIWFSSESEEQSARDLVLMPSRDLTPTHAKYQSPIEVLDSDAIQRVDKSLRILIPAQSIQEAWVKYHGDADGERLRMLIQAWIEEAKSKMVWDRRPAFSKFEIDGSWVMRIETATGHVDLRRHRLRRWQLGKINAPQWLLELPGSEWKFGRGCRIHSRDLLEVVEGEARLAPRVIDDIFPWVSRPISPVDL